MEEVLRFFYDKESIIYGILFLLAIWYIRKFIIAWEDVRGAAFGLERESAQSRLNGAAILLVFLMATAMAEFIIVSFIVPAVPGAIPLSTPTIDLLATPTVTLSPALLATGAVITATQSTPSPEAIVQGQGCIPDQLTLTYPKDGQEISGVVILTGTVDIPNFGFYQYEVARPGETMWLTIQVGREVKHNQTLGEWDTRTLAQGDYMLRLVATDNQGEPLATCVIRVRVLTEPQGNSANNPKQKLAIMQTLWKDRKPYA
jgi:hypothetical protein